MSLFSQARMRASHACALGVGVLLVALLPAVEVARTRRLVLGRIDALSPARASFAFMRGVPSFFSLDTRAASLASWQTVGGCGAGASTGSGTGVKWIGRGVSGGLFNVMCQTTYTRLEPRPEHAEHHSVATTTITLPFTDRTSLGVNLPFVYKYMRNPYETGADLSNGGLGDVSVMLTTRLGPIGATAVTGTVGLPTGEFDGTYRMKILNQSQQRGFGKAAASLMIDHTHDELWGLTVVGATVAWRGGENAVNNYRAPVASTYGYVGYMIGPFTPALGLTLSGLPEHDRDQTVVQRTGLFIAAANVSVEWATDWVALMAGASFPYQYDGLKTDTEARPRQPWGWGPWVVGLGLTFAPF